MRQRIFNFILVSALVLPFMSCSEEGFNEFVEFDVFPDAPYIILIDTTIGSGDDTLDVSAPWFLAGFRIENNHTDPNYLLVVPALALEYRGPGGELKTTTLTANDACSFVDDPDRVNYAIIPPGGTVWRGDNNCDVIDDGNADLEMIFFGGVSDDKESENTSYLVTVTLEGYYIDSTDIDDPVKGRVRKIISFSTQ